MTVIEATMLIEAANQVSAYERQHKVELWNEFYDFAEKMLPIVDVGMEALESEPIEPWEKAYEAMDREIERVFGIKIDEEG